MNQRERLARIVRLKERLREVSGGRLANANAAEREASSHVEREERVMGEIADGLRRGGDMSAREMSSLASLHARSRLTRDELEAHRAELAEVRDARAIEHRERAFEVRRLELLEDRYAQREESDARRAEQTFLDERAHKVGAFG
ncbi:MAG: hypothetical protein AB7S26_17945 [Sandaracinaceae bacterium]